MISCPNCGQPFAATEPLTKRQAEVYLYLWVYAAEQGYAPTFEEIAAHFAFTSLATVHEHLSNLERKGCISRSYNESRATVCLIDPMELGTLNQFVPNPTGKRVA